MVLEVQTCRPGKRKGVPRAAVASNTAVDAGGVEIISLARVVTCARSNFFSTAQDDD
jgi:hypothetical protein